MSRKGDGPVAAFDQRVVLSGVLGPGVEATWWFAPLAPKRMRWFTAQPYIQVLEAGQRGIEWFPPEPDTAIEITHVSQLLKGEGHSKDGTGGTGDLMAFVTLRNVSPEPSVSLEFELYMAESNQI
jgi:hypothetical protein